ncbi:unnamed protein product [Alternaria alternata]|jgi:hypothetical protein
MEKPYWGDAMPGLSYGTGTTYPDQHPMDILAKIPQSTSLLIELDLTGVNRPRFIPLSGDPTVTQQAQKPETAQIFLCASSADAMSIFQRRGFESTAGYIEEVANNKEISYSYNKKPRSEEELLMPYDPRCLVDWLSIQPGQGRKMLLPEYVEMSSKPQANYLVVHSQLHLTRSTENKYMAIWFDFRDLYRSDGEFASFELPFKKPPDVQPSTWQRRFACRFQGSLSRTICHAVDFPSYLLLDFLESDIMASEKFVLIDQFVPPVATHAPIVFGNLEKRLDGFEFMQSMIRKAEGIHGFVTYMSSPQALDLVADESRSSYKQALHRLEIGSSFLVSELRRQDQLIDKRLELYSRFSQMRQASSISAITYCAAFFLPLSLAGTFLSMQSRAKDLHLIVYDFCGMTAIFLAVAALIYSVSRLCSDVKSGLLAMHLMRSELHELVMKRTPRMRYFAGFAWLSIVVSFLVGMLHNLRLGLIMLATPVAVIILYIPCVIVTMIAVKRFKKIRKYVTRGRVKDDIEAGRK